MKWFLDLKVAGKLALGFGTILVLVAATAVVGWNALRDTRDQVQAFHDHEFVAGAGLASWRSRLNAIRANMLGMIIETQSGDTVAAEAARSEMEDVWQRLGEDVGKVKSAAAPGSDLANSLPGLVAELKQYEETVRDVIEMLQGGTVTAEILALVTGVQAERYVKMRDQIRALGEEADRLADQRAAGVVDESDAAVRVVLVLGAAAIVLGFLIAFGIGRSISRPLGQASATAARIAEGDLSVEPPRLDRRDEVGELARNFGTMTKSLREMTRDIHEGVGVLSSAAQEISATTGQISASASETAAAVSQTTATLGETRQTVTVATQKAQQVAETAQQTTQAAAQGRRAVEQSVEGMRQIRAQMDGLAQSILRLSEQSQTIGEITATVQDLAEQSNLLAVNAAIEAAKAGEAGRGFGVVAQEIKSLAEQSRQATAQVRAILAENQKATGAAVMATEQCGKTIDAGARQSQEAGESIRLLGDAVARAAETATQIAATSKQQMVGVDQATQAMDNINKASQQNVAATGQAAQAARNVLELGEKLRGLVERFRL
ncbi:MAG: methyl-accepting chemotaxis protein [Deltaproteobacteria bacterium]|nr:methyl-accepting chemotaxis protein [Deltaproteobacteria bacterium]